MKHSGMDRHVRLEYKHRTANGTSSADATRAEFFSAVRCDLLRRVHSLYRMDFELFEYDPEPFFKLCDKARSKRKSGKVIS